MTKEADVEVIIINRQTKKQMWVILVVLIFFGSTIAFAVLQALGITPSEDQQQTLQEILATQRIFDGYNETLEGYFVQSGFTVLTLEYDGFCCSDVIQYIESMISENNEQIVLFKNDDASQISLRFYSLLNRETTTELTTDRVFDILCNTMMQAPLECVLRHVNTTNKSAS